jgi:predicted nuclease with TOPRIM domain
MYNGHDEIKSLKENINFIISLYKKNKGQREKLQSEKNELTEQLKIREKEIQELKDKYKTLTMSKSVLASSEDSHDAKIKVNRIVREIDKCIALLNR